MSPQLRRKNRAHNILPEVRASASLTVTLLSRRVFNTNYGFEASSQDIRKKKQRTALILSNLGAILGRIGKAMERKVQPVLITK